MGYVSSRHRKQVEHPMMTVSMILGIGLIMLSLIIIENQYKLADSHLVKGGLSFLLSIALVFATFSVYKQIDIMVDMNHEDAITILWLSVFLLFGGYFAFSQATFRFLNTRLDRSEPIVRECEIIAKHRYISNRGKKPSVSYALDLRDPDTGIKFEYPLSGQRELDQFTEGDLCVIKEKKGFFNVSYYMSASNKRKPLIIDTDEEEDNKSKKKNNKSSYNKYSGSNNRNSPKDRRNYSKFGRPVTSSDY